MDDDRDVVDAPDDEQPARRRRRWPWVLGALVALAVAAVVPLLISLGDLDTVALDQDGARQRLDERTADSEASTEILVEPTADPGTPSPSVPALSGQVAPTDHGYRSFLVVGSDARVGLAGSRADVVLVGLVPQDGTDPVMFSLPRDLWLDDPCHGGQQRINAAWNGCPGSANGFELLSVIVEDFTGIEVDHVAAIDFDGFREVIDAVGGVRICVEHAVRDGSALSLPAGCTVADGSQALAWVRSRKTEELVGGEWQRMDGVNDLTRNRRQQDLLLQLFGRVGSFGTVSNLYSFADGVSDSVAIGAGLSLVDSARIAWSLRGRVGDVERFAIPVAGRTTSAGADVLVPIESFATTFEREVGIDLQDLEDGQG